MNLIERIFDAIVKGAGEKGLDKALDYEFEHNPELYNLIVDYGYLFLSSFKEAVKNTSTTIDDSVVESLLEAIVKNAEEHGHQLPPLPSIVKPA